MPTPPPDPNGRPSSAKHAPGVGGSVPPAGDGSGDSKSSTESHHTGGDPLSAVFRNVESSRRQSAGSDILNILGVPAGDARNPNTDDAPTVITNNNNPRPPGQPPGSPPSVPLVVTGDSPTVAGRRLGHYELIEAIGAGGMAAVLKARDLELGRVVALKILPPESARDPESVTRFRQEARAAALLDHENIARVYSCGEDQGLYFIAFEFVEGINLRVMIDRRGTIPPRECVRYMIQVAAGLAHAAQRGVVHRDIKPSNIIITPDGRAKIVDMGLARHLDATPANGGVTQSGVTLGTFDYISPEQALDPRRADVRSDIYSLGCAFYHALTGRPPVPEGTAAQKLKAHERVNPLDPRQINPLVPDELVVILARMMAKDPAQRYQSPADLIAHLKGLAERLQLSTDTFGQDSVVRAVPAEQAVPPAAPRLRVGWVVGAAAVAIAVAAFAMSGGNPAGHTTPPPWAAAKGGPKGGDVATPGGNNGGTPNQLPADDGVVRTAGQLAAKMADPETTLVELAPGAEIDLTTYPDPVAFKGKELELRGSATSPAVLRVNAVPVEASSADAPRPGSLSLAGATGVTITGVRFEIHKPAPSDEAKSAVWAALVLPDADSVALTDCVFSAPTQSVGAVRVGRAKARVRADRCVFAATEFGLWVPAGCDATVADCGFGPHEAAVQVGDPRAAAADGVLQDKPADPGKVRLDRSSFLLAPDTAVVRNVSPADAPGIRASVTAGYCVFARVGVASVEGPVVVRSAGPGGDVRFSGEPGESGKPGRKNAYYGVRPLAVTEDEETRYLTFDACKAEGFPVSDAGAVQLAQRPWARAFPLDTLTGNEPWPAFALRLTEVTDAAVFVPGDERVIGAQFHNPTALVPRRAYPKLFGGFPPPPKSPAVSENRQLVWDPDSKDDPLPKDTYTNLAFLLTNARPGDTVLIRHNGLLRVDKMVELEKPRNGPAGDLRLRFKPAEGFTPVLAPPGGKRIDQTLFQLMNGDVTFEGLQFLLKPEFPRDGQTVVGVAVVGGKSCWFEDCVFTLAEEDDSKAATVLVADPAKVMAMDVGNRPVPDVRFRRCVVRGKGRGVWVDASRAVRVDVDQSLTAIDGPLFLAQPGGRMTSSAESVLRLNRVTAFVGGPLVEMRGGKVGEMRASGLVKLNVFADGCLFAAVPAAGRPLVELDGIDPTEVESVLTWRVKVSNRYANFDPAAVPMVVRPNADGTTPKESNWTQWATFAGEPGNTPPVGAVTFEKPPAGLGDLAAVKPADAAVKAMDFPDLPDARPADAGVAEKLPTPVGPEP